MSDQTPPQPAQQLEALRAEWRLWSSVRPDRCVDYTVLPLTREELDAADGCPVVAAYQVRERKLAEIEVIGQALTSLIQGGVA